MRGGRAVRSPAGRRHRWPQRWPAVPRPRRAGCRCRAERRRPSPMCTARPGGRPRPPRPSARSGYRARCTRYGRRDRSPGRGRAPGARRRPRRAASRRWRGPARPGCATSPRRRPAAFVHGDDLLDPVGCGKMGGEQLTDAAGGTGDRDDGAATSGRILRGLAFGRGVGQVSRCANLRIWGTHRASPAVVFSTYPNDAYVPGGVHPAAGRESAEH